MDTGLKTNVDVLVAGAGPVGLLLAAELCREGLDVLIVDPMEKRSFFCKALGVTPRTLQIFDDLGFIHEAIDRGVWLRGLSFYQDGALAMEMDLPEAFPFGNLSLAQFETERLLEGCLQRHGGTVSYGWALEGFEEGAEGVSAELTGPDDAKSTVHCRWLVGCDGAHSRVRSALNMDFEGGRYPQTFILADLEVDWALTRGRAYRFTRGAAGEPGSTTLMAIPVHSASGRRYRLSTMLPESAAGEEGTPTLEQVTNLMRPLLPPGTKLSSLHWSSTYRISHRIVSAYSRGRVFLAGDAAHLHPPVGGLGMNTGLQDAHNLAWKLALASRDLANPSLLESYSLERLPVGLDVVENTSRALNDVLAQRAQLPGMKETQLLISYRASGIVRDERPEAASASLAAGDLAPDAGQLQRRFVQQPFRLHERLGRGRHVLLGFLQGGEHSGAQTLAEMLGLLCEALGTSTAGLAIASKYDEALDREDLLLVVDRDGEFAAAYEAQPGMAWLIRPDGYIGWCSAQPSVEGLRAYWESVAA